MWPFMKFHIHNYFTNRVLKRVMTSLHVSGDPLTTESLCRVMWSNNQSQTTTTTSPPPGKKRRLNQLVASVMEDGRDRGERHGGSQPLMPGHAACLVVATVQQPPGKEATIICSWRENDQRGTMEVARMEVTSKLILSGELCVDKCCLDSWDGELVMEVVVVVHVGVLVVAMMYGMAAMMVVYGEGGGCRGGGGGDDGGVW